MVLKIKLCNADDVVAFSSKCKEYKNVDIDYVYGRYFLDCKSIVGLLSTELNKPCNIKFNSDDKDICERFKEDIEKWIYEK